MDVYNGGNTPGLAGQVSAALVKDGYTAGKVGNTSPLTTTEVLYGTGAAANASQDRVDVQRDRLGQLDAGGRPRRGPARRGRHPAPRASAASSSPSPSASSRASASSTAPGAGTVSAKNGIPCVD